MIKLFSTFALMLMLGFAALSVAAHGDDEPIPSGESETADATFDIVYARITRIGSNLYFQHVLRGDAGEIVPEAVGTLANAEVLSYVWPTSLDTSVVGFEPEQGILALAVTAHPDFDDTPLWDENGDGDTTNDGSLWHSHWIVLVGDEACGEGGLKVRDILEGETPIVPETWAELPLLLSSPNYDLELTGREVVVTVPQSDVDFAETFNYDGGTAGLRVNADVHNPLLCVTNVSDIASGDLSLPGIVGS